MKNISPLTKENQMRNKFFGVMANGLAGYLDFSLGVLYAYVLALVYFGIGVSIPLHYLLLGVVFSLLPDLDIIPAILWNIFAADGSRKIETNRHHSWLTHRPIIVIPIGVLLGLSFAGGYGALLALIAVSSHFLHDALFGGDLNLFWPLGKHREPELSGEDWLAVYWMRPSKRSVIEIGLGTILVLPTLLVAGFPLLALLVLFGLAVAVIPMWLHARVLTRS